MNDIRKLIDKIESIILGLCIIGILMFIIQLSFFRNTELTTFHNLNEINSNSYGYVVAKTNNNDSDELKILVNGKSIYKFDGNNEVQLKVFDGDIIEIDSTKTNKEIEIIIVGISKNVESPKLNYSLKTMNRIDFLSKVKLSY